jgi:hypothetical protein
MELDAPGEHHRVTTKAPRRPCDATQPSRDIVDLETMDEFEKADLERRIAGNDRVKGPATIASRDR